MSGTEWLFAIGLLTVFYYANCYGPRVVQRLTGRGEYPVQKSNLSDAVYFGLMIGIGFPPIFLWRDAHWLVSPAFLCLGMLMGTFVTQALFGNRVDPIADSTTAETAET